MAEPRREGAGPAEMAAAGAVAFKPARRGGAANGMAARHGASRRGGDGRRGGAMEARLPYDDFPVVFLPPYESPPAWVPPHEVGTGRGDAGGTPGGCCRPRRLSARLSSPSQRLYHPDYNNELTQFLPRTVVLKKPPGAQVGHRRDPPVLLTASLGVSGGGEMDTEIKERLCVPCPDTRQGAFLPGGCVPWLTCLILQLGFNIRGGKASQLGIFISKVCPPFPAPCQVPWVLQGRLGVCGHRHTPCARPRAQSCNLELAR